jgi:hypothetical protein
LAALFISSVIAIGGCGKKEPDAVQLRSDLEKRLEKNKGETLTGNAEIYKIVSLQVTKSVAEGENHFTMDYQGEVECLNGFYMSAEGRYSLSKPEWKAVRHVTKGKLIEFTGRMTYELDGNYWKSKQNSTTMSIKYAPRI